MAAWYILSALGFYPLCPAKPEYTPRSPTLPRATVHLPEGKTLVVENTYKGSNTIHTTLDGKPLTTGTIQHEAARAGGKLRFS